MSEYQVYKLFNSDGELLYVGISANSFVRIASHLRKPWGKEVSRQEISPALAREDALTAEADAIKALKPRYNICHNAQRQEGWRPDVFHPYELHLGMHVLGWDACEAASQCGVSVKAIEKYLTCEDISEYEAIYLGFEAAGVFLTSSSAYITPDEVTIDINAPLVFGRDNLPDCLGFDDARALLKASETKAKRIHLGLRDK